MIKEKFEEILSEALAILFGKRVHVIHAKVGVDDDGSRYVHCFWMLPGAFTTIEGRIYEGFVRDSLKIVPQHALLQVLERLSREDISPEFRNEIVQEVDA